MANCEDFKKISKARLRTVEILMKEKDWEGSAYMMGYVLECALKAVICKTLNLVSYPERTRIEKVDAYFNTHRFEQLLIVSGLSDIFSPSGPPQPFQNWGNFTLDYQGEWPSMRYDPNRVWDESKVKKLYTNLVDKKFGILTIIEEQKRW